MHRTSSPHVLLSSSTIFLYTRQDYRASCRLPPAPLPPAERLREELTTPSVESHHGEERHTEVGREQSPGIRPVVHTSHTRVGSRFFNGRSIGPTLAAMPSLSDCRSDAHVARQKKGPKKRALILSLLSTTNIHPKHVFPPRNNHTCPPHQDNPQQRLQREALQHVLPPIHRW